jgi:hypothetical protein
MFGFRKRIHAVRFKDQKSTINNKQSFFPVHLRVLIGLVIMTGCDPVHSLKLENKTNNRIEVVFFPTLDNQDLGNKEATKVNLNGREFNSVILNSAETIRIGMVTARDNPTPNDIGLDYLEVRMQADTLKLIGKTAIFTTLQKVEKLDWRLIIRAE